MWETCIRLSQSEQIAMILGMPQLSERKHILWLCFNLQLSFIVSHEHTHVIHGHLLPTEPGSSFADEIAVGFEGSLLAQAREIDADVYAINRTLDGALHSQRSVTATLFNLEKRSEVDQDKTIFLALIIAVAAFFYVRAPVGVNDRTVYKITHPPQAVRMHFVMHFAMVWAKQNREHLASWMTLDKFQFIMNALAAAIKGPEGMNNWQAQNVFLQSNDGTKYMMGLQECLNDM
jgi:hypothetical protein